MGKLLQSDKIAGGTSNALQTDFPTSVTQVFATPPKAAQVLEGDFVGGVITSETQAKPETDFNVYAFPEINDSGPVVMGGGDVMVMFKDNPAAKRADRVPGHAGGGRDLGRQGRLLVTEQEASTRTSIRTRSRRRRPPTSRTRRSSASTCPT